MRLETGKLHLPLIDMLRGFAAISVCLFHLACGNAALLHEGDPVKIVASFGWLGVEIFFVISGFVLPYALWRRGYTWKDAGSFLLRRLKRLHPPYIAAIGLVLVLNYIASYAPGFQGLPPKLEWPSILSHLVYLNSILGIAWFNPVFWTLAIEIQYYLFLCAAYPLFVHPQLKIRLGSQLVLLGLAYAMGGSEDWLPHWLPLFGLGLVSFQAFSGLMHWLPASFLFILFGYQISTTMSLLHFVAGLASALILVLPASNFPLSIVPMKFLGRISYSLYLVHAPVGGKIINLTCRLPDELAYRYVGLAVAMAATIVCSYVFWRFVEVPSQKWSANEKPLLISDGLANSGGCS